MVFIKHNSYWLRYFEAYVLYATNVVKKRDELQQVVS